ncbi:hypothetical protein KR009_003541 [Drosophila setifemur]|nr:hypothetical protein KR009_003541 [Drosophila setifemur]
MEGLMGICNGYSLLIGMTSYRLVNGCLQQTRLTQAYAIVMNILTIGFLPWIYVNSVRGIMLVSWMPRLLFLTPYVISLFNYLVLVYTLVLRFKRDSMLVDLQNLSRQLNRKMSKSGVQIKPKLRRLLYLKSFIFAYLCLISFALVLDIDSGMRILEAVIINVEYSIRNAITYSYFASFWQVSIGFDYVNHELEKLACSEYGTRKYAQKIRGLWDLHSLLSRMSHRINRIFSLQMLVTRMDYMAFAIIFGYVGMLFINEEASVARLLAASIYFLRSADFFLNDYICEVTAQYQCQQKHTLTEGNISEELSVYLIYESCMRLDLKVCGLFSVNVNQWLGMAGFINGQSILIFQFYLASSDGLRIS